MVRDAAGSATPGPKLILGGRALQDETQPLSACSLTPASKVLVLAGRSAPQVAAVHDQGDRAARIDRLKAAATAMASRSEEYVPSLTHLRNASPCIGCPLADNVDSMGCCSGANNGRTFMIENQAGHGLRLSEEDRKALGVGLAMHGRGQQSLEQVHALSMTDTLLHIISCETGNRICASSSCAEAMRDIPSQRSQSMLPQGSVKDALQELLLAEEAFGLASLSLVESIDNIGLLLLDITWCAPVCNVHLRAPSLGGHASPPRPRRCFFLLQDSSKLAAAADRLQKARGSLERSHGVDMARLRVLHGGFRPETAV